MMGECARWRWMIRLYHRMITENYVLTGINGRYDGPG
jgi:hypothetical protein